MKRVAGSDNVFEDLGFDEAEAALLKAKSDATLALRKAVERAELSQTKAAEIAGMSRPTLNRIFKGDLGSISLDRIFTASHKLGVSQKTVYTQARRKKAPKQRSAKVQAA